MQNLYFCDMRGNTIGTLFKVTTYGESHGSGIGVVVDGCPAGLSIDENFIQSELDRRKPGQSKIVTQRKESDTATILSGIFNGLSTGVPIAIHIPNEDQKSKDYDHIKDIFRPSHADFTYHNKFGLRDYRGGGRSSARETAARVAAGAIAKLLLNHFGITIHAYVSQVGNIKLDNFITTDFSKIEDNIVRCPDMSKADEMIELISSIRKQGDTVGGMVTCQILGCPAGLGEPVFDRLHADLAKAMLSINAAKGFEYGTGFDSVEMKGSQHNDSFFTDENGKISTTTNYSGGIQGGISNGMPIYFNVAFKPVATIVQAQDTVDIDGNTAIAEGKGRHDPCVVPRAVPIVEAMAAITLADHILRNRSSKL